MLAVDMDTASWAYSIQVMIVPESNRYQKWNKLFNYVSISCVVLVRALELR